MTSDARIEQLAEALRQWIEQQDRSTLPELFANFPTGACGIASCFLSLWLEDQGEPGFESCTAYSDEREHVWLTRGDLVVDITGDQFGWPPVIVTRNSKWHPQPSDYDRGVAFPVEALKQCIVLLESAKSELAAAGFSSTAAT
jgi:hypothetical protein